jgi:hypothetical protein
MHKLTLWQLSYNLFWLSLYPNMCFLNDMRNVCSSYLNTEQLLGSCQIITLYYGPDCGFLINWLVTVT